MCVTCPKSNQFDNSENIVFICHRLKDLDQVLESEVIDLSKLRAFCFNGNTCVLIVLIEKHSKHFYDQCLFCEFNILYIDRYPRRKRL